jgi:hypothetical protein
MDMRLLLHAAAALLLAGPAHAQQWVEFRSDAWGVSINFPQEPRSERIEYTTYYQDKVPARVFSAERGTGRYTLTCVSFSSNPIDSLTAVMHAVEPIRAKGRVTYQAYHDLDGIPGYVMSITEADGRLIQSAIYFVDQRLYIAEGSVGPGNPAPSQFQQSIRIFGPENNTIVLDEIYPNF